MYFSLPMSGRFYVYACVSTFRFPLMSALLFA